MPSRNESLCISESDVNIWSQAGWLCFINVFLSVFSTRSVYIHQHQPYRPRIAQPAPSGTSEYGINYFLCCSIKFTSSGCKLSHKDTKTITDLHWAWSFFLSLLLPLSDFPIVLLYSSSVRTYCPADSLPVFRRHKVCNLPSKELNRLVKSLFLSHSQSMCFSSYWH